MDLMPLRITTFFHAFKQLVYPILFNQHSLTFKLQEENDQAFSVTL